MIERAFSVGLTIPDNEAYTALTALRRLNVVCASVARSDVHVFGVQADLAAGLEHIVPTLAGIYNPNKHRLRVREHARPEPGEVWITARELPAEMTSVAIDGVVLPGVRTAFRATSWRLLDERGEDVESATMDRAVQTLLCNPSFQRAIR